MNDWPERQSLSARVAAKPQLTLTENPALGVARNSGKVCSVWIRPYSERNTQKCLRYMELGADLSFEIT